MTSEEIDKYVEEHIRFPKDSETGKVVLEWAKIIAKDIADIIEKEKKN